MRYQFLRFPEGKAKAVTLSYDDGVVADLRFADVVSKAGMKCTFNLNSNVFRKEIITDAEIEEHMLARGHEIAVHGAMHRAPGLQRPLEGVREVLLCREELEARFKRIIRGMAYPDSGIRRTELGSDYDTIRQYLQDLGIVYSRTLGGDNDGFFLPTDWYAWMPTAHHNNPHIFEWIDKFLALNPNEGYISQHMPRLFYIWGHAFEFDNKDNWDLLDQICEKLGGHEDIWYATNMEIYEYVQAYNALVYSSNSEMIYNPTLHTVWLEIDGTQYSIGSGETLCIDTSKVVE